MSWVPATAAVSGDVPMVHVAAFTSQGWTLVTRASSRAAWFDAVVGVDAAPEVDDPHEDQQERDQDERELDEGLAAVAASRAAHLTVTWTAPVVFVPAALVTRRVT